MSEDRHTPPSEASSGPLDPAESRPDLVRVGVLGMNAWAVTVLLPTLHVGLGGALEGAVATLPLAVLVLGLAALGRRDARARWVLLAAFPPVLAAPLVLRERALVDQAFDAVSLGLAALCWLAYLSAAAHAVARPRRTKPAAAQALTGKEPVSEPAARRWMRRALLAVTSLGAFVITVIAPAWTTRRARVEAWGEASDDGAVLTAIVAAVIAAVAVGSIVGSSLRADRRAARSPRARARILALSLLVASAAGMGWVLLAHFDPPG